MPLGKLRTKNDQYFFHSERFIWSVLGLNACTENIVKTEVGQMSCSSMLVSLTVN